MASDHAGASSSEHVSAGIVIVCERPGCKRTGLIGGYCSDACLQADTASDDLPPVTVLAPNKVGGFGRGLHWMQRQAVYLPPTASERKART